MGLDVRTIILMAPVLIFSLTVHEFFHAWTAKKFGDLTAFQMGRVTLNPLAHLDFMGTLMLVASQFHFGWGKPVPVNLTNLKNPRRDDLWISAAGPLSNLGLALIIGIIIRILGGPVILYEDTWLSTLLRISITLNVSLAFFNLLPLFPLDGSHVLRSLLPERYDPILDQIYRVSPIILIVLIFSGMFFGVSLLWMIIGPFVRTTIYLFAGF